MIQNSRTLLILTLKFASILFLPHKMFYCKCELEASPSCEMRSPIPPTIELFWHQPLLGPLAGDKAPPKVSPQLFQRASLLPSCAVWEGSGRTLCGGGCPANKDTSENPGLGTGMTTNPAHSPPRVHTPSLPQLRVWSWGVSPSTHRPRHCLGDPRSFWLASTGQDQFSPSSWCLQASIRFGIPAQFPPWPARKRTSFGCPA